jgi:hypothetical protein
MIQSRQSQVTPKWINQSLFNAVPAVSGNLNMITLPAQGVTNGERESDSLSLDFIQFRFILSNAEASIGTTNADMVRILIVQARASTVLTISAVTAPTTGILDNGFSGAIDISSHVNLNTKSQLFNVLYDRCHPVNFSSSNAVQLVELNLKPKIRKINFTPGTTTPQCGGVWVFLCTTLGNATVSVESRLVYIDL